MLKTILKSLLAVAAVGAIGLAIVVPRAIRMRQGPQVTPEPRPEATVTVVEGKRREEIAVLLEKEGVCTAESFLQASDGKEGFLFPDTYRFFKHETAQTVVDTMLKNFSRKTAGINPTQDNLILAAIVEREAQNDEERQAIAGVYTNRLRIGMKLDADPTVQYAKDTNALQDKTDLQSYPFWKPITSKEYRSVLSPYNTYLNGGLPPAPIANPGLNSIEAAVHPAEHTYLYFFHRDTGIIFSETLNEHLRKLSRP